MRKGCLFKTTSLFFFLSEIKKGERTHATKTLCQTAQKDDVERRRGRAKNNGVGGGCFDSPETWEACSRDICFNTFFRD